VTLTAAEPRPRLFAGWIVVGAAFVVLMTNAGLGFYGLAVYLEALTDEQGFSTASVSAATSVYLIAAGVTGRYVAHVIDRHDMRWPIGVGAVLCAVSLLLLGRVTEQWQVFVVYTVFGVGFAGAGLVPATTLVTRWFHRRRSVALSVASTGLSVGGLTLTVLASVLIDRHGLRAATPWLASLYVVLIGLVLPFIWPDPASRGVLPDGDPTPSGGADVVPALTGVRYERAVQSRFFWIATASFMCFMGAQVGAIAQLAKLGTERIDRATGALMVSAVALASVVARLIGGVLAARVPLGAMTATIAAGQAVAMAFLAVATGKGALIVAAAMFGATVGNLLMLQPLVIADAFGVRDYARVFSLNQLIVTVGVAGGPFLLGALHDSYSYRVAYLVAAGISVTGTLLLIAAGPVARVQREWS
jgi:MFS family permease